MRLAWTPERPARSADLARDEVHIWLLDPVQMSGLSRTAALLLPESELQRAARFSSPEMREQWCNRRVALRSLLSQYCGCSTQALPLDVDALGKPYLGGGCDGLHFSVSGSQGWWLAAVASEPIGVDLEIPDPALDWGPIAERYFSGPEKSLLAGQTGDPDLSRRSFYRLWTRKEAWLKLRGSGLAGLDFIRDTQPPDAWIEELALEPGLQAAVALDRPPSALVRCDSRPGAVPMRSAL